MCPCRTREQAQEKQPEVKRHGGSSAQVCSRSRGFGAWFGGQSWEVKGMKRFESAVARSVCFAPCRVARVCSHASCGDGRAVGIEQAEGGSVLASVCTERRVQRDA